MRNSLTPNFEDDPQGYIVDGCLTFFLRYGIWIVVFIAVFGSCFRKSTDNNQPTPIPRVIATEKPHLLTMFYEQTADADQSWKFSDEGPGLDSVKIDGCPMGCTYHKDGCDIKGNISYNSGEKIYHIPGQEFYSDTEINDDYGERWFCTESEAKANGWRKSYK